MEYTMLGKNNSIPLNKKPHTHIQMDKQNSTTIHVIEDKIKVITKLPIAYLL
jgi:hypothetical protein